MKIRWRIVCLSLLIALSLISPVQAQASSSSLDIEVKGLGQIEVKLDDTLYQADREHPLHIDSLEGQLVEVTSSDPIEQVFRNEEDLSLLSQTSFSFVLGYKKESCVVALKQANDPDLEKRQKLVETYHLQDVTDDHFFITDVFFDRYDDLSILLKWNAESLVPKDFSYAEGSRPRSNEASSNFVC